MRILLFLGILILPIIILSKTIIVKDKATNKVITDAFAYSKNVKEYEKANKNGEINISKFESSKEINISAYGYKRISISIDEINNRQIVYLESSIFELDEIVLSASKWEVNKIDLSSRIESYGQKDINFRNPQTSADLLGQTDYVYIQKSQMGGGSPMIRGFATNRVLLVVDGVRMNNAIFRSGNLQNVIMIDANAIENSEVLFGPGSVMYGSDAIGGVMDFHTLSPQFNSDGWEVNGNAMIRSNSANFEKTFHFDINVANDRLAFLTSFSLSDYDNMIMGSNGSEATEHLLRREYQVRINGMDTILQNLNPNEQVKTAFSQFNIMQKVRYKVNEYSELEGSFHYSESSDIPRYDNLIRYNGEKLRDARWDYGPQVWSMNNLRFSNFYSNDFYDMMKIIVAYQSFEESRITRRFGRDLEETSTENVGALSLNIDFDKSLSKLNLGYGFEYVRNDINSEAFARDINSSERNPIVTRYPDGSDWTSIAGYFTGRYSVNENIIVNFGLRYSQFLINAEFDNTFFDLPFSEANINDGSFSGSLGSVYKFNDKFHSFVNLSSGFRAPNIDDIGKVFESSVVGAVVVPNPNLSSELAYNAEIGFAGLVDEWFYFDFSAYYTLLDNVMSRRDFLFNGQDSIEYSGQLTLVQAVQNLDLAYIYGIQAGVKIHFLDDFEFNSKINYQVGEEQDANGWSPLRHAAPLFGSTKLSWKKDKYHAEVFLNYNGSLTYDELAFTEREKPHLYAKDENGQSFYEGWFTLNLRTSYNVSDNLSIFIGLDNLFDRRYIAYSSGIVSPGRSINGSVRYSF